MSKKLTREEAEQELKKVLDMYYGKETTEVIEDVTEECTVKNGFALATGTMYMLIAHKDDDIFWITPTGIEATPINENMDGTYKYYIADMGNVHCRILKVTKVD